MPACSILGCQLQIYDSEVIEMKTLLTVLCTSGLILGIPAMAQTPRQDSRQSTQVSKEKTTETNSGSVKTKSEIYYGKVESYEPGKTLKVSVPGKLENTTSFDLDEKDETVNIPSNVKVGDWVRVDQQKDNNGHTTLTVKESTKRPKNG
jgi:hypothetical protein